MKTQTAMIAATLPAMSRALPSCGGGGASGKLGDGEGEAMLYFETNLFWTACWQHPMAFQAGARLGQGGGATLACRQPHAMGAAASHGG
jgi:hypothetical protein